MEQYGHKEVRQRDNIAEAKVYGINVSANAYLGAGFNLSGGYTHLNTQDVELEQPIDKVLKTHTISMPNGRIHGRYIG